MKLSMIGQVPTKTGSCWNSGTPKHAGKGPIGGPPLLEELIVDGYRAFTFNSHSACKYYTIIVIINMIATITFFSMINDYYVLLIPVFSSNLNPKP